MEFLSWSLNAPTNAEFNRYMEKVNGKWQIKDPEAIHTWADNRKDMFIMFEKYHDRITSFGFHEFGVNPDGTIYDRSTERKVDNEKTGTRVLDSNGNVVLWVKNSLQYLMETYPNVRYAIQIVNMQSSNETKVDKFLDDTKKWDVCIDDTKRIAEQYIERFPMIKDIEVDFERAYHRDGDEIKYRDFLIRIKNEVCIPLGLGLRVNMYAMTGDFVPYYYSWHDYKTLSSAKDKNGNRAINEFQIMTYDFTYADSAPGPSTPLWWLENVLEHVKDSLPVDSTWVGNAGYGRRWGLDNKQSGRVVTYKQLAMWQNGMYVHNHEEEENWIWHNQDWLPFVGYNDEESMYQVTYPHMYDKFNVSISRDTGEGTVNRTRYSGKDIITSYFKSQQPIFKGIQGIANEPVNMTGNVSSVLGTVKISAKYLGEDVVFGTAKRANRAVYQYDKNLEACVPFPDERGKNGEITFNLNVKKAGNYKLIALVHFNTYQNTVINAELNGKPFVIGGDKLDEWWPFIVDEYAWLEVGNFDFNSSNTIKIKVSSGYIRGFVVCEDFDQNFLGGQVEFNSYLAPFKKRGQINENGYIEKVTADMPEKMTITAEILRREPRPAIIYEDIFSHYFNRSDVKVGYNITNEPYYLPVQDWWDSGPNKVYYEPDKAYACTDSKGIYKVGFSDGNWQLQEDGTVRASVPTGYSNQLVLYKKFSCNIQVRVDIKVSGAYPLAGIRFLATEEGNGNQGYLALLDYAQNKVTIVYEDGKGGWEEITSAWMSDQLIGMKGDTTGLIVSVWNGTVTVKVGDRVYIDKYKLPYSITSGAYGAFIKNGTMILSLFNVSTIDRYEPLEKVEVEVDGKKYVYGEVPRSVGYDEYGYLKYSGLDIKSTEITEQKWSTDYLNEPLAVVPSWTGRKYIKLKMLDAGIWVTYLYIGDTEGFSVSWNSDREGFIRTSDLINKYKCRGVAMWTMGQEDPLIYEYIPKSKLIRKASDQKNE
jgi:spore germination protein YaaH